MVELNAINSQTTLYRYIREKDSKKGNKDGRVSPKEDPKAKKLLGKYDSNKNGMLEANEIMLFANASNRKGIFSSSEIAAADPTTSEALGFQAELLGISSELNVLNQKILKEQNTTDGMNQEKYIQNQCKKLSLYKKSQRIISKYRKLLGESKFKETLKQQIKTYPGLHNELLELSNISYTVKGKLKQLLMIGVLRTNCDEGEQAKIKLLKTIASTISKLFPKYNPNKLFSQFKQITNWLESPKNQAKLTRIYNKKYGKKASHDDGFYYTLDTEKAYSLTQQIFPASIFAKLEKQNTPSNVAGKIIRESIITKRSRGEQKIMFKNFLVGLRTLVNKMAYGDSRVSEDGKLTGGSGKKLGLSCISVTEAITKIIMGHTDLETSIKTGYHLMSESKLNGQPILPNLSAEKENGNYSKFKNLLGFHGRFFIVQTYDSNGYQMAPKHAALIYRTGNKWMVLESACAGQPVKTRNLDWWLGAHSDQTLTLIPLDSTIKGKQKLNVKTIDPNSNYIQNLKKEGQRSLKENPYAAEIKKFLAYHRNKNKKTAKPTKG